MFHHNTRFHHLRASSEIHREGSQAFSRAKNDFERHGVECADLDFWRGTEVTNKAREREQGDKQTSKGSKLQCLTWMPADRCTICCLLRLIREVHGVGTRPWGWARQSWHCSWSWQWHQFYQCRLCHSPDMQDRGEMAKQSANTEEIPCRQWPAGSSKLSLPIPNAALFTGFCSLSSSTHDEAKASWFQSRRALREGVHVNPCYMSGSINTSPGNFCILNSPYAADSHHHRVDGPPQVLRVCAPIHQSGLCWVRHSHRPGKWQGRAREVRWENKLFEGKYVLTGFFAIVFFFL